jgi:glycosyltransferase 2 family protein
MDKKTTIKYFKKLLQLGIYIAVGYFIYTQLTENWGKIADLKDISYLGIAASILIFSFHSIFNGLNWHYMITQSDWDKTEAGEITKMGQMEVYLKSYILRYVPGNVVGILSRAIYNKKYKVPMVLSLWGWFLENITYLAVGLIIGLFVAPFLDITSQIPIWMLIISAFIGLAIILMNDWLKIIFNKFLVPKLPESVRAEFVSLDLPLQQRLILTGRYFISWIIYSLSFIILVTSLGLTPSLLLISINAMAWSIGYLSFITPSGTGIREGVMSFLLIGGLAYDGGISTLITILARIVSITGELLSFGFFYLYKLIYTNSQKDGK